MSESVDFALPGPIRDFVFDLHQSTRVATNTEDVVQFYEVRYKELTDKYFAQSAWPEPKTVSPECGGDNDFLLFYKEMTARHLFTKLKPQLKDFLESWTTYTKLFEFVLNARESQLVLTTQWVNDIIQEFVYQLQGFCQYRCQVASRTADEKQVLQANRSVWTFPAVSRTLSNLVRAGKANGASEIRRQFGSFAAVELARLECLIGDYTASLKALGTLNLNDRAEIFIQIPTCHVNVFYHAGLSYLMIRRYADAIDTFSDIALHVSRTLKPGAANLPKQIQSQLQKMLDKILSLTAIAIALCPGYKVDDQVRELVESKLGERLRKMTAGDIQVFVDIFEHTCPKFISPVVPDYSVAVNIGQEAFSNQVSVFIAEVIQQVSVLKIRSYMRMYTSIDLSTLAKFNEVSEPAFISQLISFRHKSVEVQNAPAGEEEKGVTSSVSTSDVQYYIQDQALVIDTTTAKSDKSRAIERFFTAGARKHVEIAKDLNRAFARIGI